MQNKTVDKKVLDRVRKLLALAADGGATEHEAALAAERARQIMAENGISNATIEASGGEGEARTSDSRSGHTGKHWMREIMRALADQAFVVVEYESGRSVNLENGTKWRVPGKWQLWGRESAVVTVKLMHEYLVRTVDRVARERGTPTNELFKEAMGSRIAERIEERHQTAMYEQARAARSNPPASAGSGNALVVVLEDYAQKERDLNNDLKNGWSPGTTAQRRLEREAEYARRTAERETKRQALLNEGLDEEIVELIMSGISRERAVQMASEPEHVEKNEKDEARRAKEEAAQQERWQRYQDRINAKFNSPSYRAGRQAGEHVGLDTQVGKKEEAKKLS